MLCPALVPVCADAVPDFGEVVLQTLEGVFRGRGGITSGRVVVEPALPTTLRRRLLEPFASFDIQHPERLWVVLPLRMD